jgi:hypothetical protein
MVRKPYLVIASIAVGILSVPVGAQTTFTYTGSLQPYNVPSDVNTLFVRLWGAGGANGGGGGAFVSGDLSVTPGSMLEILVGGGGGTSGAGSFGGGGSGAVGGDGGGRSAIILSGTDLVDAGAGGAGGDSGDGQGGAGGLTMGQPGTGFDNGGGGSQVAGGSSDAFMGTGSLYQGGNGDIFAGGGGGGFYGGGGGGFLGELEGSGGGGGSSLTSNLTGFFGEAGSGMTPGGMSDPFYISGVGAGGISGGNGEVVITAIVTAVPEPGSFALCAGLAATGVALRKQRRAR